MKLKKMMTILNNFFQEDQKSIEENKQKIEELIEKLYEKKGSLDQKYNVEEDQDERIIIKKKLKAIRKLIKKAKESLTI